MTARARATTTGLAFLAALAAGCGGSPPHAQSGIAASTAAVDIAGRVVQRGTRGSVLVFAYTDLAPGDDPAGREPASVATLPPDGAFSASTPPAASLSLVFLADGANDGVIDGGDLIAVLTSPELADLQAGDRVELSDVAIDFKNRRVTATIDVARTHEPERTPTAVPQ
jgi:hypothetical protein